MILKNPICFFNVFRGGQNLQIPRHMQAANGVVRQGNDVIDVMLYARRLRQSHSFQIKRFDRALIGPREPLRRGLLIALTAKTRSRFSLLGVLFVSQHGRRDFALLFVRRKTRVTGFFNGSFQFTFGGVLQFCFCQTMLASFLITRSHSSGDALFILHIPRGLICPFCFGFGHVQPPIDCNARARKSSGALSA